VRIAVLVLTVLMLVCLGANAFADKYAAEFLKVGAGARALGMGGAFVALANDASATYWNPAGLVSLTTIEVSAMHAEQFGEIVNYDFVTLGYPFSSLDERKIALGAALIRLAVDDIPYTANLEWEDYGVDGVAGTEDEGEGNGEWDPGERILLDEGKIIWKSNADMALLLSYATEFNGKILVGGTFKLVRQELMDNSSLGAGIDLGVIYVHSKALSFGAMLADATTTQLIWDTGHNEFVAPTLRLGSKYTRAVGPLEGEATGCLDMEIGFEKRRLASQLWVGPFTADVKVGVEYWLKQTVALRTGLNAGRFTAGAGARFSRFGFDYAFLTHKDLDNSHRVSASVTF
jgi:hypothetical protein